MAKKKYFPLLLMLIFLLGCSDSNDASSSDDIPPDDLPLFHMLVSAIISIIIIVKSLSNKELKKIMLVVFGLYTLMVFCFFWDLSDGSFGVLISALFAFSPLLLLFQIISLIIFGGITIIQKIFRGAPSVVCDDKKSQ